MMADLIDRQTIIETIHSAIYPYFCGAEDGDALSKDEKLVLSVNKAVCTAIKALPSAQPDVPDIRVGDMISRQAAIDTTDEVTWYHQNKNGEMVAGAGTEHEAWYKADDIYKALKAVPSVDAAEVVRCKDCYHYIAERRLCFVNVSEFEPTDFCSYGERKDG